MIGELSEFMTDCERLRDFRQYAQRHFNDGFRLGQGTEVILDFILKYQRQGDWVDLGCGPTTLFWSIPLDGITSITCVDESLEAIKVLDEIVRENGWPTCYSEALKMVGKAEDDLWSMASKIHNLWIFDALDPWPEVLCRVRFDLITQFGLFGLSATEEEYVRCISYVLPHMNDGACVIGANWRSRELSDNSSNARSRYLRSGLASDAASSLGLRLLDERWVDISNDPEFDGVLVWALSASE